MNNREAMQEAFETCERYAGRDFTKTNGVYADDGVQHEFGHFLEGYQAALASQAQQPTKELFSLYSAVNNLVAHIGMVGEITSKHDLVDAVMNSLYDLDGGSVAKRADDLIEKAFMPQSQALKLAANEYIAKESK